MHFQENEAIISNHLPNTVQLHFWRKNNLKMPGQGLQALHFGKENLVRVTEI